MMMREPWSCPAEESWTRFLLNPEIPQREEFSRHLDTCEYCRVLVAAKERELDMLAMSWAASGRPDVIHLSLSSEFADGETDTGVLAAKGKGEIQVANAAALSSPQHEMLLRVVRDQHKGEVWLYLMAEDVTRCSKVIVKPFGEDQEYITDEDGRVNLGVRDWPKQMTAEVHLPRASFTLRPFEADDPQIHSVILESSGGDRIKVTYEGDRRNRRLEVKLLEAANIPEDVPLKVAVRRLDTPGLLYVQSIISHRASFENVQSEPGVEIYLYK